MSPYRKLDEVPYDFQRKRLSVLVEQKGESLLVTKGAVPRVLEVCSSALRPDGSTGVLDAVRSEVESRVDAFGREGFRVLAVATRSMGSTREIDRSAETEMSLVGLVAVYDPPKPGVSEAIRRLDALGIRLVVISGDTAPVVRHIADEVGLTDAEPSTGAAVARSSDDELAASVATTNTFAEVEPDQKERIIDALKREGDAVGYIGDGINDAPAIRAADVGLSVEGAVDVAKETADIVVLEKDLGILADGVRAGRETFANTLKYVFMATSANFGNMFSMAGASLFLPFLPLLPKQILLNNLMADLPEMAIAGDSVDPELVDEPRRWDIGFIRRFMVTFGLLSSVFDYLTFGVLLLMLNASEGLFRTGWFVESVVSASIIVLVVRTRRPFFRSRPGRLLRAGTALTVAGAIALPYTPIAAPLGFRPLPVTFLAVLAGIVVLYVAAAEAAKRRFYRREGGAAPAWGPGTRDPGRATESGDP